MYNEAPMIFHEKKWHGVYDHLKTTIRHGTTVVRDEYKDVIVVKDKDVDNPKTEYHSWLESHGNKMSLREFLANREELINSKETTKHYYDGKVRFIESNIARSDAFPIQPKPQQSSVVTAAQTASYKEAISINDSDSDSDDYDYKVNQPGSKAANTSANTSAHASDSKSDSKLDSKLDHINADNIYNYLNLLQWRDKDEQIMTIKNIKKIDKVHINGIINTMKILSIDLRKAIDNKTGALGSMSEEECNNFLFHIIAKGQQFYFETIADPEFCLYLLDQYQPLYTYLMEANK